MANDPALDDVGDMPPDEFRSQALALVDWIAAYLSTDEYPVLSRVHPGAVRDALAGAALRSSLAARVDALPMRDALLMRRRHMQNINSAIKC